MENPAYWSPLQRAIHAGIKRFEEEIKAGVIGHSMVASDCATSIAPAQEPGPCDCDEPQQVIPEDYLHTTVEQRKRWCTQSWHGHEAPIHLLLDDIDTLRERLGAAEQDRDNAYERVDNLEAECDRLQSQLRAAEQRIDEDNVERNRIRAERDRLKEQLARCGKENCFGWRVDGVASWVREEALIAAQAKVAELEEQLATSGQLRFAAEQEIDDTLDVIGAAGEKRDLVLSHLMRVKIADLEGKLTDEIKRHDVTADQLNDAMIGQRARQEQFERMADLCDQVIDGGLSAHDAQVRRDAMEEAQKALRTEFDDRTDNLMGNIDRVIAALIEGGA